MSDKAPPTRRDSNAWTEAPLGQNGVGQTVGEYELK